MPTKVWKLITENRESAYLSHAFNEKENRDMGLVLTYPVNVKVRAAKNTPGIFVYTSEDAAQQRVGEEWRKYSINYLKVVPAIAYGKPKVPEFIGFANTIARLIKKYRRWNKTDLDKIYMEHGVEHDIQKLWPDTACYKEIMCLE